MCGIGQVLQMGFGMMSSAAQSRARIEEQTRQFEANKAAAEASFAASRETAALQFIQNNQKVRQQQFDFELLGKMQVSQLKAQAGASNLRGVSIRNTISDASAKISKDSRRFIDERKNMAAAYKQELHNLEVTKINQINTVVPGRWTMGDTLGMLAPVVNGFAGMMIQQQNRGYQQQQMSQIGQMPGGYGGGYGGNGYSFGYNPMAQTFQSGANPMGMFGMNRGMI